MVKTREIKIGLGCIYRGIELRTGQEIKVKFVGGEPPRYSVIGEDRHILYNEVTDLEPVEDLPAETLEE